MKQNGAKKKKRTKWQYVLLFSIIFLIVISIPFIINEAYKMGGYKTVWNGADVLAFYGTLLGAIGTVSLGALALWQNKVFRHENKREQERLEKLNIHANEVNIINKIVEYEMNHLNKVNEYSNEFIKVSVPLEHLNSVDSLSKTYLSLEFFFGTKTEDMFYKMLPLLTESIFHYKNSDEFISCFVELFADSLKLYTNLKNGPKNISEDLLKKCKESLNRFKVAKDAYIIEGNKIIKNLLLEDYTLKQIRELSKAKDESNE